MDQSTQERLVVTILRPAVARPTVNSPRVTGNAPCELAPILSLFPVPASTRRGGEGERGHGQPGTAKGEGMPRTARRQRFRCRPLDAHHAATTIVGSVLAPSRTKFDTSKPGHESRTPRGRKAKGHGHGHCPRDGFGRADRRRGRPLLQRKGFRVVGIDNNMRKQFFGDDASTDWSRRQLEASLPNYAHHNIDIRDRGRGSKPSSPSTAGHQAVIHTAAQPSHDWAAKDPAHRLHRQRQRHADAAGGHPPASPRGAASSSPRPTRSTATTPTPCRWSNRRRAGRSTPSHPYAAHGIDETPVHRSDQALAVRRLEAGRRRPGPGVRPLLRHEHGLLPGRLPDRPRALRHAAARLPLLSGQVRHHRRPATPSSATRASRSRDNIHSYDLVNMFWHYLPGAAARRGLQRRRRPAQQLLDARSHRPLREAARARR